MTQLSGASVQALPHWKAVEHRKRVGAWHPARPQPGAVVHNGLARRRTVRDHGKPWAQCFRNGCSRVRHTLLNAQNVERIRAALLLHVLRQQRWEAVPIHNVMRPYP